MIMILSDRDKMREQTLMKDRFLLSQFLAANVTMHFYEMLLSNVDVAIQH